MTDKFIEERLKHEHSESLMFDRILTLEQQLRTATEELEKFKKANDEKNEFLQKLGINASGEFNRIKYYFDKKDEQLSITTEALQEIINLRVNTELANENKLTMKIISMENLAKQALAKIEEVK